MPRHKACQAQKLFYIGLESFKIAHYGHFVCLNTRGRTKGRNAPSKDLLTKGMFLLVIFWLLFQQVENIQPKTAKADYLINILHD